MWKILGGIILLSVSMLGHADEAFRIEHSNTFEMMIVESLCIHSKEGCYIYINDDKGREMVRISERTGKVTVSQPERLNEAARQFWRSVELAFQVGCKP